MIVMDDLTTQMVLINAPILQVSSSRQFLRLAVLISKLDICAPIDRERDIVAEGVAWVLPSAFGPLIKSEEDELVGQKGLIYDPELMLGRRTGAEATLAPELILRYFVGGCMDDALLAAGIS